ncbi:MAG: hypothetical protein P4N60_17135 [Verrucomicrobiae bacterium]|nr:hypothetical protein [Verrucomicrobiae bacterium]
MKAFEDDVWSMRARKQALRRKRRWQAALALAVLSVLALMVWLAVIGSPGLAVLFAALFIGTAVMMLFYTWRGVAKGELPGRFGNVTFRHASPTGFWIQIAIYVIFAAFCFFTGLGLLGLAPHWFILLVKSMHSHR